MQRLIGSINFFDLLLTLMIALGFIGNSCESYARSRGWPVGRRFPSWAAGSFVMVPLAVGIIRYFQGWMLALLALLSGYVLAWLLTGVLQHYVQLLWAALMLAVMIGVGVAMLTRLVG